MKLLSKADVRQRFDEALEAAGSKAELARRLGVTQPCVSQIALGKRGIGPHVAKRLGFVMVFGYRAVEGV